jgi:hypothetical protein
MEPHKTASAQGNFARVSSERRVSALDERCGTKRKKTKEKQKNNLLLFTLPGGCSRGHFNSSMSLSSSFAAARALGRVGGRMRGRETSVSGVLGDSTTQPERSVTTERASF